MDWYDKIHSMDRKQLAEFLGKFDRDELSDDFCQNLCPVRSDENRRCSLENEGCHCDYADPVKMMEIWLGSKPGMSGEDFLALFDGIEEDGELNQRRMKNLEELRF